MSATSIFSQQREALHARTDRMFALLMIGQYLAGIAAAYWVAPMTWAGEQSSMHLHLFAGVFLGGAITSLPVALALMLPGHTATRHGIAAGQMMMSALLIHLTGGRIETHFHIFGSLAFLSFYRDWRVLVTASAVTILDHYVQGLYWPASVYGTLAPGAWRWLEHSGWVVFEDVFLVLACIQSEREMRQTAERQSQLEQTKQLVERAVIERTHELKRANAELHETQAQLLQSQKLESIGQLAGGIAHDFNNLLTSIVGYTDLLRREYRAVPATLHKLDVIARSTRRGGELVNQLLGFARKGAYEKRRLNLNACVNEANGLISHALPKNIAVQLELHADLLDVEADSAQMLQVLMNLAVNARDAMPSGGKLEFRTENAWLDEATARRLGLVAGPHALLTIEDTGAGIPPELLTRVFDPFFTTKPVGKGTGLGLSMVYGIVKGHGGVIELDSEPGRGTRFRLYLPALTAAAQATAEIEIAPVSDHRHLVARVRARTILVADDEAAVRDLVAEVFRGSHIDLLFAEDGAHAVDLLQENLARVDLALLDIVMPNMDGIDAHRLLRALRPQLPILFASGYANGDDVSRLVALRQAGFLRKPFTAIELLGKILEMQERETRPAAPEPSP